MTAASAGLQTGRLNLNMTGELLGVAAIRLEDGESWILADIYQIFFPTLAFKVLVLLSGTNWDFVAAP